MNISNQCPFQEPLVDVEFAGFWLRFFAIIIDMLILPILLFIFVFLISLGFTLFGETVSSTDSTLEIIGNFLIVISYWLYFTILESSSWQATIGKNAMGLIVTDEYGNRISFLRANVRYWSKILSSIFMIGFLITAITAKKQGLHDIISNTLVIRVY